MSRTSQANFVDKLNSESTPMDQLSGGFIPDPPTSNFIPDSIHPAVTDNLVRAISHTESNDNPYAIGPNNPQFMGTEDQNAVGKFQQLASTARQYGVQDRTNPEDAEQGARRHLSDLANLYNGNVDKMILAYHQGQGNVNKGNVGPKGLDYLSKVKNYLSQNSESGFIPDSFSAQPPTNFIPDSATTPPDSGGSINVPPIDPNSKVPDYINRVGYGLTKGLVGLYEGTTTNPGAVAGGVAASVPDFVLSLLPWVEGSLNIPRTTSNVITKGWRQTVKDIQENSETLGSTFSPKEPSPAFQAGHAAMGLPYTAATEATGGIADPQVKAIADTLVNAALLSAGGRKGGEVVTKVKGEYIPGKESTMADIPPKQGPGGGGTTYEGTATRGEEPKALPSPSTAVTIWNPEKVMQREAEAKAPNQADLLSYVNDLKTADPKVLEAATHVVEREAINSTSVDPTIPHDETPTSRAERANQVATLATVNELAKEKEEITLRPIPVQQPPANLPPVAVGDVRLYRGGDVGKFSDEVGRERQGQNFTSDRNLSTEYGPVNYVDVPKAVADASNQGGVGHLLPREWAAKAVPEVPIEPPKPSITPTSQRGGPEPGAFGRKVSTKSTRDAMWKEIMPGEDNPKQAFMNGLPTIDGTKMVEILHKYFPEETKNFEHWIFSDTNRDIKQQELGGITSSSWRSANRFVSDMERIPEMLFHYINGTITRLYGEEHAINATYHETTIAHNNLYGVRAGHIAKVELFRHDLDIYSKYEVAPEKWFDGVDYTPSTQMMIKDGMSPESAAVWRANGKDIEKMWSVLEKAVSYYGGDIPKRIPGWLPHVWKGPYQVIGTIEGEVAARYNYYNRSDMLEALKHATLKTKDRTDVVWNTQVQPTLEQAGPIMLKELFEKKTAPEKAMELRTVMGSMDDVSYNRIISHAMERQDSPVTGHLLERVNEKGIFGISRKQAVDSMTAIQKVQENVSKWYSQTKYLSEHVGPLWISGLLPEKSNLERAVTHITNGFFGHPDKILRDLDSDVREWFQEKGLDPNLGNAIFRATHTSLSTYFLVGKPAYYTANYFQKTLSVPILMLAQAQGTLRGEATGSITTAISRATAGRFSEDNIRVTKWLEDHGKLDPNYTDQINPGFRDPISAMVETNTRRNAGLQGYHYFSQFMSEEQALLMAGQHADRVAVPYSGRVGQPIAVGRLPTAVKPLYLFISYRAHMLGLTSNGIRTLSTALVEAVKDTGPAGRLNSTKAALQAVSSISALQLVGWSLFGLGGVVAMSTYDSLAYLVGEWAGFYIPPTSDLGMKVGAWASKHINGSLGGFISNSAQVGLVSNIIRYDISSSGAGVAIDATAAGKEALEALLGLAMKGLRDGAYKAGLPVTPVSRNEYLQSVNKLPTQLREPIEYIMKTQSLGDVYDLIAGKQQDWSIGRTASGHLDITLPGMPRTQGDTIAAFFGGLKSVEESMNQRQGAIISEQKKMTDVDMERISTLIKDPTFPMKDKIPLMLEMTQAYYQNINSIKAELQRAEKNSQLSDEQRQTLAAKDSLAAMMWWQKRQDLKAQDTSRVTPLNLLTK